MAILLLPGAGADRAASDRPVTGPARLTTVVPASEPVEVAFRAGDRAMYVAERHGVVLRALGDEPTVALDLTGAVRTDGRNGLLGLAFSAAADEAYVQYSDPAGNHVVAAFSVREDGSFDPGSRRTVITIEQPYPNDRGGDLVIGPDGLLYVGSGDGGGDTDPDRVGQSLITMLGKLLRIDPRPSGDLSDDPSARLGYSIPDDNPYTRLAGLLDELWSVGLQDPRQFSFDADTGDLWVADVGHSGTQEITVDPASNPTGDPAGDPAGDAFDAGRNTNFGWSAYEGERRVNNDMTAEAHRRPLFTYPSGAGPGHRERCAISGGVRARGEAAGALAGYYVFADFCSGEVLALPVDGEGEDLTAGVPILLATTTAPTAVVAGPEGELYVLSADAVLRIDLVGDVVGSRRAR